MSFIYTTYQYFSAELQKIALNGITDTIKFFQALQNSPVDPNKVAPFAAQALATIFAGSFAFFLMGKYLIKIVKKIDQITDKIGELLSWTIKIIKSSSKYSEIVLRIILRRSIVGLIRKNTYVNFLNWCGMMSKAQEISILNGSKDGSTFVRYQRAMGITTLAVAIWSTLAFSYSVYIALISGDRLNDATIYFIPLGGIIYGTLIFFFDRSIIAPFYTEPKTNIQGGLFSRAKHQLNQIDISAFIKILSRGTLTLLVAKFTALPMSMLLLGGSIKATIDEHNKESQASSASQLDIVAKEQTDAQQTKEKTPACINSIQSLKQHDQLIEDEAHRCTSKATKGPCIGDITKSLQSQRPAFVSHQLSACSLSPQEILTYTTRINSIKSVAITEWKNPPDILLGGYILDAAGEKYKSSFDPINAIFFTLFSIEMIPVFMKILKGNSQDRRKSVDRRQRNEPWPYAERRKEDRRLRLVG